MGTAMLIHFYIICDCGLQDRVLWSQHGLWSTTPRIFTVWPFTKKWLTPARSMRRGSPGTALNTLMSLFHLILSAQKVEDIIIALQTGN